MLLKNPVFGSRLDKQLGTGAPRDTNYGLAIADKTFVLCLRHLINLIDEFEKSDKCDLAACLRKEIGDATGYSCAWRHVASESRERTVVAAEVSLEVDDQERGTSRIYLGQHVRFPNLGGW